MGLHFHSHSKNAYIERGRDEAKAQVPPSFGASSIQNPYDRLNAELEQHILKPGARVHADSPKKRVSDAALALRQAVHDLRHPKPKPAVKRA